MENQYFITGSERKRKTRRSHKQCEKISKTPIGKISEYGCWDSGVNNISYTFKELINNKKNLLNFLEEEFQNKKIIWVELGGVAKTLNEDLINITEKSIGVALRDSSNDFVLRDKIQKIPRFFKRKTETKKNHQILEGNVMDLQIYPQILDKLGVKKVDFILERMGRGLTTIPKSPFIVMQIFQNWYEMLNDDGIILAQVPFFLKKIIPDWAEKVNLDFNGKIEVNYSIKDKENEIVKIKIKKKSGAPDELPVFTTKELIQSYQK